MTASSSPDAAIPTATCTIRLASAGDIARLAELRYEFRSSLAEPIEDRAEFLERCGAWMSARLDRGQWWCWVVEEDGRIIGNVWIQLVNKIPTPTDEPEEHAYLTNFSLLESARGRGIGSEMIARVLEWTAEKHVHVVFLWPTTRTRGFYERNGFRADGDMMQVLLAPRAK